MQSMAGTSDGRSMTDFVLQRRNMVESQVRPSDITDRRIIRAMLEVPREAFVPRELAPLAYIDGPLPVTTGPGPARHLLPPRTFAKLIQLAEIGDGAAVLDVGCATGYSAAVLARIAGGVVGLEAERGLAQEAERNLRQLGVGSTSVIEGRLADGAPHKAPFDAILLNGAISALPPALLQQLRDGGRLVAMLREGPVCRAHIWRRSGEVTDRRPDFEGAAAPLPGFDVPAGFVF